MNSLNKKILFTYWDQSTNEISEVEMDEEAYTLMCKAEDESNQKKLQFKIDEDMEMANLRLDEQD